MLKRGESRFFNPSLGKFILLIALFLLFSPSVNAASFDAAHATWFYIFFFLIAIIILVIGYSINSWLFQFFAGALFSIFGIYIFINGIPGHVSSYLAGGYKDGWIFFGSVAITGIGLYYFLTPIFSLMWKEVGI